ncbi:MAG TPA: hypothetical protein VKG78_01310, partial [Opitutaceae bacterium]|nr:hypothetical protein [Opitutaceae bacterium]
AEFRRLMSDKDASQGPEFARLRPFPADPFLAVILRMALKEGAAFPYQALVTAHRDGASWNLTFLSGAYVSGYPEGEPREAYGNASFLEGDPRDDARLRAMAADLEAFSVRVAETRRNIETAHYLEVSARRAAFLARIAPGSVFRGAALRAGEQQGTELYLEITGVSSANAVTALLRNAGGWHYARHFQGSWAADEDFKTPMLNLSSQPGQAVRNAGPFLENTQAWALALQMDSKGDLSEANRTYQYRFQFVNTGEAPSLKASLADEFDRAMAAASPGSLYSGTAVSKASGASQSVLLRFAERADDGDTVDAVLESTAPLWKRPVHGAILANSRRSDGAPIRLRSSAGEAAEGAPAGSVLGDRDDLEIRLATGEGSLSGSDERYRYRFSVAGAGDRSRLDAALAARASRLRKVLRDGIAYDGTIRDDQGSVTQARLEVDRVDRQAGTISASIHSLVQLDIYSEFQGVWETSDASITLDGTGQGNFDLSDNLAVPFLVAPVARTLQLALVGDSITGGIKGDAHWTIEFPVGEFARAPAEGAEPDSPPANGSVYPQFPKAAGAYLLSGGTWGPLPRNNPHVTVETIHPKSAEEESIGFLGVVSQGVGRLAGKGVKISYLEFDGKDPRPDSAGAAVTILFIGQDIPRTPSLEVAAEQVLKDGRRGVEIPGASPGSIQFGEQRVAAYVRRAGPGATLLTATSALPPGPYALSADVAYEFGVRP